MSLILDGSNGLTFPNSTTQAVAGLTSSSTQVCQAWVRFSVSGGACTIAGQYNVSSVSYLSTGQYQVNFTNAITDTNYAILVSGGESQTNYSYQSILTTSIQPVSRQDSGSFVNPSTMSVAIHR